MLINIQGGNSGNWVAPESLYRPEHDDPYGDATLADAVLEELSPPRPFPELQPCDTGANATLAALQSWLAPPTSTSSMGDICSTSPMAPNPDKGFADSPCWNVQRGQGHIILWQKQDKPNAQFALVNGRFLSNLDPEVAPGEVCVGAPGVGEQLLLYTNCSKLTGSTLANGFSYDQKTGQLRVAPTGASTASPLCVTAKHCWSSKPSKPTKPGKFFGALRSGPWKLIVGYPGNGKPGWDGWVPLKGPDGSSDLAEPEAVNASDCKMHPCLFNIETDPNEHNDVSATYPAVVTRLQARLTELAKSEVTVDASGLCPTQYGTHGDPRCGAKAKATGFWEPWL